MIIIHAVEKVFGQHSCFKELDRKVHQFFSFCVLDLSHPLKTLANAFLVRRSKRLTKKPFLEKIGTSCDENRNHHQHFHTKPIKNEKNTVLMIH